jgi:hypothetical protein
MKPPARVAAAALAAAGLLLLPAACNSGKEAPPPAAAAPIGEAELRRGKDACAAYVDQVCTCAETVMAAQRPCALSRALPESIDVAIEVSAHPDTERRDVVQSAAAVRKTIARCIEQTAKLPELGCPAPHLVR